MNGTLLIDAHRCQSKIIASDAQQAQANNQHAGNGATAKGDVQSRVHTLGGGLRRTHVGANGHEHADIAGQGGKNRTNREADGELHAEANQQNDKQCHTDHADREVLAIHVGAGAFLNSLCDFLHAVIAGRLPQNPACGYEAIQHCQNARANGEPQCKLIRHQIVSQSYK